MAFANENLLSGKGPQPPHLYLPQSSEPVVKLTITDPSNMDAPADLVALLNQQDETTEQDAYEDWEDTGGSVRLRMKAGYDSADFLCDIEGKVLDASIGSCSFRIPQTATESAGIYVMDITLYNKDGILVVANEGFADVQQNLSQKGREVISVAMIRKMMRDTSPAQNRVLEEVEFTDSEISDAIDDSIDEFNAIPPVLSHVYYTAEDFPWVRQLVESVIGKLLRLASLWYIRNDMKVSAAGISADDMGKGPVYRQLSEAYAQEWEKWVKLVKRQLNIQAGWGRVRSRMYPLGTLFRGRGVW